MNASNSAPVARATELYRPQADMLVALRRHDGQILLLQVVLSDSYYIMVSVAHLDDAANPDLRWRPKGEFGGEWKMNFEGYKTREEARARLDQIFEKEEV